MTINNPKAFTEQLWDWAVLEGCFGQSKIKPTDIDGLVEHNGYFLMLEAKNKGVPIPQGQAILHNAWLEKGNSLIVVYGEPGDPQRLECYIFGKRIVREIEPATIDKLRDVVSFWYKMAHKS